MSDSTATPGQGIELPPQLASRLEFETAKYSHTPEQLAKESAEVEQRHADLLAIKKGQAHDEVQHAKDVAAAHKQAQAALESTQSSVSDKIKSVQAKQAELSELDQALAAAEAKERELLERLGGAKP